ncbi:hypothetical protein ANANG_G00030770 [Anguilla anguilla]|uniref:CTCK domain-containing protein n=1 Tax=Anguilla anguilla TaxID=7936 RepID=A0A9D3MU29_ANGAN|nr:hypothetical protein ANANG_G00030770 [Anguilla anguilla]
MKYFPHLLLHSVLRVVHGFCDRNIPSFAPRRSAPAARPRASARRRPVCPPGVSAVADGCGCCKVCAAQLNQDCHPLKPCDHHKGLQCNYGNDVARTWGICRARLEGTHLRVQREDLPERGELPRRLQAPVHLHRRGRGLRAPLPQPGAPGLARLPRPAPAQSARPVLPERGLRQGGAGPAPRSPAPLPVPYPYPHPHPYPYPYKPDKSLENELVEMGKKWSKQRGYKRMAAWRQVGGECTIQTTSWSQCSRSCGMGVSSRVTNDNAQCKLVKETRLCNVRPCGSAPAPLKAGKKCSRTRKAPEPLRLSYAGCRSARLYRPNYCGVCVDGRCCSPRRTRTVPVPFLCPDGERFDKAVMFVQSCRCSEDCGHLNEVALTPQHWLHGDTHKFID